MLAFPAFAFVALALLNLPPAAGATATTPEYFVWNNATQNFDPRTIELPAVARSLEADFRAPTFKTWLPFKSYAQASQDYLILTIFHDKADGYFVDLASNHWEALSNSLVLEHFNNWKGVCLEPNPLYLVGLLSNRKCGVYTNPVTDAIGERVKFSFTGTPSGESGGELGGMIGDEFENHVDPLGDSVELVTVTLEKVLEHAGAPRVIDYLSLDIEGAELHALKGFPFDKHIFLAITVERPSKAVHHILVGNGYRFVRQVAKFGDILYMHTTFHEFGDVMTKYHQPCKAHWNRAPHDQYLLHPVWKPGEAFGVEH